MSIKNWVAQQVNTCKTAVTAMYFWEGISLYSQVTKCKITIVSDCKFAQSFYLIRIIE